MIRDNLIINHSRVYIPTLVRPNHYSSIMFSKLLVTVEGTNLSSRFIPNELTIMELGGFSLRHYFINPPPGLRLSPSDRTTDWFTRTKLGGRGIKRYNHLPAIRAAEAVHILELLRGRTVYTVGSTSKLFLSTFLPEADVVDVQTLISMTYPKCLPSAGCGEHHTNPRHCTMAKAQYVCKVMADNTAKWI